MSDPVPQGNGRRIKIEVPDIYRQVDESVWEELETYLFQGFLTATTVIAGKTFVLKTLNALEVRNVNFMRPTKGVTPDGASPFKPIFIAHSVFMIDGVNTLYERPRHINRLIKVIGRLQPKLQDKILENLSALKTRAERLYPLAEPYCFENRSRYRWLQIRDTPVHSPLATGIPGTDELGMNYCQQMWTAVNRILDRRDEVERDWQNAKFIGSCFAGKGIRSIDEKDRMRLEKERVEREETKMKVLYNYLNRRAGKPEPKPKVQLPDGRWAEVVEGSQADGKFRAETAEELAEQLEKALAGEKDFHDLVIEAKEKELRARARAIQDAQRAFFYRPPVPLPGAANPAGAKGPGTRIIGGKEEADAYIKRMKQLQAQQLKAAARQVQRTIQGSDETSEPEFSGEE